MRRNNTARAPRWLIAPLVLMLLALIPVAPARAANTFFVDPLGDDANSCLGPITGACKTIGGAIGKAIGGDTISIAAGVYDETIVINKSLTLIGAGADQTFIDGGAATLSFVVQVLSGPTTLNSLAVRNGYYGGVENHADLTINTSIISGNGSRGAALNTAGGGISNSGTGSLLLSDSLVSDNIASRGAGVANYGNMVILGSTIAQNTAQVVGFGGGIANYAGSLSITDSTISDNLADGSAVSSGGGIVTLSTLNLVNSTISGNRSPSGAALWIDAPSRVVSLESTTVSANSATNDTAGISIIRGTLQLLGSILAGNHAPTSPECSGALVSQGYNLIGDNSGCAFTPATGDQVGSPAAPIDPRLGALSDNGGPTETMAPLPASPTLDAIPTGAACGPPANEFDQRAIVRPQAGGCEIGAYEADGLASSLVFAEQPQGGQAGALLATQPVVGAEDLAGNGASFSGPVTLALAPASGVPGATLGGTLTVNAVNGAAAFSNVTLGPAGTGYQLIADSTGLVPAESALFDVTTPPNQPPAAETEPNNIVAQANLLAFNTRSQAARVGAIGSTSDIDLYGFTTPPGATVIISLTNLPADYDLALLPDPRATLSLSDSVDLDSIVDLAQEIPDIAQEIPDIAQEIPDIGTGVPSAGDILARSARRGTADETLRAFLPRAGSYFVLVYGHAGEFQPTQQYRLAVTLRDGTLESATAHAQPVAALNLAPDTAVRTIYLYNTARMASQYGDEVSAVNELSSALQPTSPLLAADPALGKGKGIALDLSSAGQLGSATATTLARLYNRWDNAPDQPLLANELAQQIFNVLERAITGYYPNTTDIVLVGGDAIIPFYRVPDETQYANESRYGAGLNNAGALRAGSALDGALFRRFIQTDNFYADREPTPWRGRALYLPDLGLGRLVERPSEILHYLNGYLASGSYTIDASQSASAALVTGYDFLKDQTAAIAQQLNTYGFAPGGQLGVNRTLSVLNNDTWGLSQFTNLWFSGQLPQLTAGYSGAATRYALTSLNGHFNHYSAIPASLASGVFRAERIYTPTAQVDTNSFFKINGGPTLLYTVGCHSGLSVHDADIATPGMRADFPQAVLKQGGNWIGNTGYGYGDYNVIGYSERLALLLTHAVGREIRSGNSYVGAPVGDALARAKRQYLRTSGGNSFSVYDEKILSVMTLYGLPFLRVKVPNPTPPNQDEPPPAPIPTDIRATLADTNGLFTRVITMTNTFQPNQLSGAIAVTSAVEDSFGSATTLTGVQQTAIGKPVLPLLTYDITLQKNSGPLANGGVDGIPIARAVQLRSAVMLPEHSGFDPLVTSTITDQVDLRPRLDPQLAMRGAWLPALPYAVQRTSYLAQAAQTIISDKLLVFPAQFNPTSATAGRLRRYQQLVFEITYVDPRTTPAATRNAEDPPDFDTADMVLIGTTIGGPRMTVVGGQRVRFTADVFDYSDQGLKNVSLIYTTDGATWQRLELLYDPDANEYTTTIDVPSAGNFYALLEAIDQTGNVAVETSKGTQFAISQVFVPVARRP